MKIQSTKVFDGYSTCFRQWKAEGTHCKYLHGYAVSFKVWFEGELDERNWVFDFGGMRRAKYKICGLPPKEWFSWLLDHTVLVAEDDPFGRKFVELHQAEVIQVRFIPAVGAEKFAQYLLEMINSFLNLETEGRVKAVKLEFRENEKNSAIAYLD